jgi:hypothetical protein
MRRIIALATGALVLLVLVLPQLLLPGIAAQQLRDRIGRSGKVLSIEVDAFPAIELLWHQADKVVIRMASYQSDPGHLGSLLQQAGDVGSLDASVAQLDTGLLRLQNASLKKRGDELTGSALVTEGNLRAAVPFLDSVTPVASGGGQLTLRGTGSFLGVSATADAVVQPSHGALVVVPEVPFGSLATVTVFSNPHVQVQGVSASSAPGGFAVTARARVG